MISQEFLILLNKIRKLDRLHLQKVTSLPEIGSSNTLYFLTQDDGFEMWIYDENGWDDMGKASIDLDDYATKDSVHTLDNTKSQRLHLICDEEHIYQDGVALSFYEVEELITNMKYDISLVWDDMVSFRPVGKEGDAIVFIAPYLDYLGTPKIVKAVMDLDDSFRIIIADLVTEEQGNTLTNAISNEISNRTNQVIQLSTLMNAESERAQGVENELVNTIGIVQGQIDTVQTNVDSLDVCIEEKLFNDGRGGYRKYKNGYLEQWGVATSNAAGEQDFALHTSFKDTNFSMFITPREMGNFYFYAYPKTASRFSIRIQSRESQSMAVQFQFLARGRWK